MFDQLKTHNRFSKAFAAFFIVFIYVLQLRLNWPLVNWSGFRGGSRYIDLNDIIKSSKCFSGNNLGIYSNITNTPCAGYSYTRELIGFLQLTHLNQLPTNIFGFLLAFAMLTLATNMIYKSESNRLFVTFAAMCPGIFLLLERGNFDILVFVLVVFANYEFNRGRELTSILLIILSALIKFYTLPLILLFVIFGRSNRIRKLSLVIFATLAIDFIQQVTELPHLAHTWFISFGLGVFPEYVSLVPRFLHSSFELNKPEQYVIEILTFGASWWLYRSNRNWFWIQESERKSPKTNLNLGIFMGLTFLTCYFTGNSYDYRLVFYVAFLITATDLWKLATSFSKILILVSLFFTTFFPTGFVTFRTIFQLIGDFAMLLLVPSIIEWVSKNIQNMYKRAEK